MRLGKIFWWHWDHERCQRQLEFQAASDRMVLRGQQFKDAVFEADLPLKLVQLQ